MYVRVYAAVAKLADALDSGSSARKGMEVQVLSAAPHKDSRGRLRNQFTFFVFRGMH